VLDEQLLESRVAVHASRVDRTMPTTLPEIRIGTVLEEQLAELVSDLGILVLARGRSVKGGGLNVLITCECVRIRAAPDEQSRSVDVSEEAGEAKWLETVAAEGIRIRRVVVQQLAHALRATERGGLEDVELWMVRKKLCHAVVLPAVERFE
jgi:hypothetical protein